MINRTLLRIKLMQTLFAFFESEGETLNELKNDNTRNGEKRRVRLIYDAQHNLQESFLQTYRLYHTLLQLIVEIHRYANERIAYGLNKFIPTDEERNPNMRFVTESILII